MRTHKRRLVENAYNAYNENDHRAHSVVYGTPTHPRPSPPFVGQRQHLYTTEELDRYPEIKRVFLSPFSADVFFLPIAAFDFTLERDRILFAIMAEQLALKAPDSNEYALVKTAIAANPFLQKYIDAL